MTLDRAAVKGASITIAESELPTIADFDPKASADAALSQNLSVPYAGTLFSYFGTNQNPDGSGTIPSPSPDLAVSASHSADGLTWTFHLRRNVLSQNGNPLTADDVVYTIKRAFADAQDGANLLKNIHVDPTNPATAVNPLTVAVHLTAPSALVVKTFSVSFLAIIDQKEVAAHSLASDPWGYTYLASHSAGFGPYELSVDELPNKAVLVANPHYWRGPSSVTKATFVLISDDSTRLEAAISGQVDIADGLAVSDVPKVKATSSLQVDLQPNVNLMFYLVFIMKNPVVQNAAVRRALSVAVNRTQIINIAYQGAAEPVTSCVPSGLYKAPAALADVNPAGGDIATAKKLLASTGGPHPITFGYPTGIPGAQALAEVVQSDYQSLGIKTTLIPYSSYATFLADQASGKFDVALEGFGPNVQDPGYFSYTINDSNSSYELGGYSNAALNASLQQADTLTGSARNAALATACRLVLRQAPIGPLVAVDSVAAANRRISGFASFGGHPLIYDLRVK